MERRHGTRNINSLAAFARSRSREAVAILTGMLSICSCVEMQAAETKTIFPAGVKTAGPYSPGVVAGGFLYVSGQGAKDKDGKFPETAGAQVKQALENVRLIVEAAGLTMDHVVYAQIFVTSPAQWKDADKAWQAYFPGGGPARAVLGVSKLPQETPVEINAVAALDISGRKNFALGASRMPDAVMADGRVYISDCAGVDPVSGAVPPDAEQQVKMALDRMGKVLELAGLDFRHVVFVNPYMTHGIGYEQMNRMYAPRFEFGNTPARATIEVAFLPGDVNIHFTGIAVRDLSQRRAVRPRNMEPSPTASPCVFAGATLFCSAKSAFIPGPNSGVFASSVEAQVRQTMRNLLDGLEEADMHLSNVVSASVYLDDIADFAGMNRIYSLFFKEKPPARTTVQQYPSGTRKANEREEWPTLEQISIVAER